MQRLKRVLLVLAFVAAAVFSLLLLAVAFTVAGVGFVPALVIVVCFAGLWAGTCWLALGG